MCIACPYLINFGAGMLQIGAYYWKRTTLLAWLLSARRRDSVFRLTEIRTVLVRGGYLNSAVSTIHPPS